MKIFLLPFLVGLLSGQETYPPLTIDVRPRVLQDEILYVVVQVDNHTNRNIIELEGFVIERDLAGQIVSEKRLKLIHSYDPALPPGNTVNRSLNYPLLPDEQHLFSFQISKIRFAGDHRIYTYHPAVGFIRID
jgi:hypothetical protein